MGGPRGAVAGMNLLTRIPNRGSGRLEPSGSVRGLRAQIGKGGGSMFTLARRSPFQWMEQVERRMDDMFGRFFEQDGSSEAAWTPACEVYARDGKVAIRCDVPGVDPGDIHVAVRGRTLTISGERKATEEIPGDDYWCREIAYGRFERAVTLPEEIDAKAVRATYRKGARNIHAPLAKELTAPPVATTLGHPPS